MKVKEALDILRQFYPEDEVNLTFSRPISRIKVDPHDPDGGCPNDPYDACMRQNPPARNFRC
jgi:hypothetical protein